MTQLIFRSPLTFSSLSKYDGIPVEMNGPILSEGAPGTAGLVSVLFPNGVVMDVFTDELYIR